VTLAQRTPVRRGRIIRRSPAVTSSQRFDNIAYTSDGHVDTIRTLQNWNILKQDGITLVFPDQWCRYCGARASSSFRWCPEASCGRERGLSIPRILLCQSCHSKYTRFINEVEKGKAADQDGGDRGYGDTGTRNGTGGTGTCAPPPSKRIKLEPGEIPDADLSDHKMPEMPKKMSHKISLSRRKRPSIGLELQRLSMSPHFSTTAAAFNPSANTEQSYIDRIIRDHRRASSLCIDDKKRRYSGEM